jgi:hypothetical protein
MKTITFKCPRGGKHDAILYPSGQAGCPIHGWLLYTEIPHDALVAMKHKVGGWKTILDVLDDLKQSLVHRVAPTRKGNHA